MHLGFNMWRERFEPLRCDDKAWAEYTQRKRDIGMNMLVIDIGEGMVYPSHPELAIKGSWTVDRMRRELARLRKIGLEPIPKLNFSACHDLWLGEYAHMVSTPEYYRVVADLIRDVCGIFDYPRFFHVGMDEETYEVQRHFEHVVCRRGSLWYHDVDFIRREIEKHGARAWMWSDPSWSEPEFPRNVAKSIVQSNWYYWNDVAALEPKTFLPRPADEKKPVDAVPEEGHLCQLRAFRELDAAGYGQMPCATDFYADGNMSQVIDYCRRHISQERLMGFFLVSWQPTIDDAEIRAKHEKFFALAEKAIKSC